MKYLVVGIVVIAVVIVVGIYKYHTYKKKRKKQAEIKSRQVSFEKMINEFNLTTSQTIARELSPIEKKEKEVNLCVEELKELNFKKRRAHGRYEAAQRMVEKNQNDVREAKSKNLPRTYIDKLEKKLNDANLQEVVEKEKMTEAECQYNQKYEFYKELEDQLYNMKQEI